MKPPARSLFAVIPAVLAAVLVAGCGGDNPMSSKNHPPDVQGLVSVPGTVPRGGQAQITSLASDPDGDALTYTWAAEAGTFSNLGGPRVRWTAPDTAGVYTITGTASDGQAEASASIDVVVASAGISVTSTPPGAPIYLNGSPTGAVTPAVIGGLPATDYNVQLLSPYFLYEPADTAVFLSDGDLAEVTFRVPAAVTELVDTGPGTMDEIGGLTYSGGGIGVLYTARSGATVTLRSASLVPTHSGTNGRVLLENVDLDESLSLRTIPFQSSELAFVMNDAIHLGRLVDPDVDGLIESLSQPTRIAGVVGDSYAPSFSPDGRMIAFGLAPSTPPNAMDIMVAGDYDTMRVSNLVRVSSRTGNAPYFGPNHAVVFEAGGELYETDIDSLGAGSARKLTDTGGHAFAPAVSPNGKYIAYLDDRGSLEVLIPELSVSATVLAGIRSTRVAWAPVGIEMLVADNSHAGDARLYLIYNLPLK